MRKIVDLLLSPQGRELVEKTGYVPVGNPSLTEAVTTEESPKEIQP